MKTFFTSKKFQLSAYLLGACTGLLFAHHQFAPFIKASDEFKAAYVQHGGKEEELAMTNEFRRIAECQQADVNNKQKPVARDCLLATMPSIVTVAGVGYAAIGSGEWLLDHPDDVEMRQAARQMVKTGQDHLKRMLPFEIAMENFAAAHDDIFVLRVLQGRLMNSSFMSKIKSLESAELAVEDPDLWNRQNKQRFKLEWDVYALQHPETKKT